MPRATRPNNWPRIERAIKLRAEHRCECGTMWDCGSNAHTRRCTNIEGQRYVVNKRRIALRVVQIGAAHDWRPQYLMALCLPCYVAWQKWRAEKEQATNPLAAQGDSLW